MHKRAILCAVLLIIAGSISAETKQAGAPLDAQTEKLVRQTLPVCTDMTLTGADFGHPMPQGLSARLIISGSASHACEGQYLLVTSNNGATWYLGMPWFFGESEGATTEEKLQNFAWKTMQTNVTVTIDRKKRSPEGLF